MRKQESYEKKQQKNNNTEMDCRDERNFVWVSCGSEYVCKCKLTERRIHIYLHLLTDINLNNESMTVKAAYDDVYWFFLLGSDL